MTIILLIFFGLAMVHFSIRLWLQKVFFLLFRYDVELFQRIEHLIGKKLPLYSTEEEEVMMLMERVTEAQRFAKMVKHLFCIQKEKIIVKKYMHLIF